MNETPKKFDRVVAVLIQLQSRKIIKAQELANRFGVSLRTIYRDIKTLETAGVPVFGEAGTGYSLVEGYRLPPVMFTKEEAGSFVAAEKLMQRFTDEQLKHSFQSAMFKIKAVLRDAQKEWVEAIESGLLVTSEKDNNTTVPDVMALLFESLAVKKQVEITYLSADAVQGITRQLEPIGIFHENNFWYVYGYCHYRKEYRQFRTDRIQQISLTHNLFHKEHEESLGAYLDKKQQRTEKKTPIRIRADKKISHYLCWERKYYGFIAEKNENEQVEMLFETDYENNGMARWLMMFADQIDILEPQGLKDQLQTLLGAINKRMPVV